MRGETAPSPRKRTFPVCSNNLDRPYIKGLKWAVTPPCRTNFHILAVCINTEFIIKQCAILIYLENRDGGFNMLIFVIINFFFEINCSLQLSASLSS